MNWDAIGALGEIIGAVAVVATLVYVAAQVRGANRALRTTIRDSTFSQLQGWNYHLVADESLAWVFQRGMLDYEGLESAERARFVHAAYSFFKVFENIYLHHLEGTVTREVWDGNKPALVLFAGEPGLRGFWERRRSLFDDRFAALVDGIALQEMDWGDEVVDPDGESASS